jgi:Uma2 family endonuclease
MADTKTLITAEQLLQMSFLGERVELSEGELIRMAPAGARHSRVAIRFGAILDEYVERRQLGAVFGADGGFVLAEDTVRAPDIGFVSQARLQQAGIPDEFFPGAPDLAVEVVSPDDRAADLEKKIEEYFRAGTRLVWVVYPRRKRVHVFSNPRQMRVLEASDVLSGNDVLPGFSVPLEKIFL